MWVVCLLKAHSLSSSLTQLVRGLGVDLEALTVELAMLYPEYARQGLALGARQPGSLTPSASIDPSTVLDVVSKHFHMQHDELMGRYRGRMISRGRWMVMAILYYEAGWNYSRIARLFDRDHTTIMYGIGNIDRTTTDYTDIVARIQEVSYVPTRKTDLLS